LFYYFRLEDHDGNILRRHLRPAAEKLGIDTKKATWRSLRTSCATWMIEAGANPKDVQGQMRHSRISTTMDIYAQHVPESQRRAVDKTMDMVAERRSKIAEARSSAVN
jgi:integrase